MAFPLADLFSLGSKLIDRVIPDPQKKIEANIELAKLAQNGELAQMAAEVKLAEGQQEINKIEAASTSRFVSGWRPFIGWTCGAGLAYQFVLRPFMIWASGMWQFTAPPGLELETLMTLLFGMLGLGGLRTFEKAKGVTK